MVGLTPAGGVVKIFDVGGGASLPLADPVMDEPADFEFLEKKDMVATFLLCSWFLDESTYDEKNEDELAKKLVRGSRLCGLGRTNAQCSAKRT